MGNLGLQGVGITSKSMGNDMDRLIKNVNSNDKIRKICQKNADLKNSLQESLKMPIDILRDVFGEPATEENMNELLEYLSIFDDGISELRSKAKLSKYPEFLKFLSRHIDVKTYSFHIFKCADPHCIYHEPLVSAALKRFGQPVPVADEEGKEHYVEGEDPDEKHLPSILSNVEKQSHNIPFTVSAQTAMNVGMTIICNECSKPRLLYAKQKLKPAEMEAFKRVINGIVYSCGTPINEIDENEDNRDARMTNIVCCHENLNCNSKIELPYYSCKGFKDICIYCGSNENVNGNVINYPKCLEMPRNSIV